MTDSNNMYGANLKEYALDVLRNKQIARSTFINWQGVIKNLPLENYQFPPNPTEIYNMVSEKYSNPRTKRAILQTLNCLLGIKMKTGKATFPIHDLPEFEEVSSVIQSPKNKYQARCRMYANLMLHAGLRIGETQYKHQIVKNSINVEFQRIYHDNSVQTAKTQGLVVLPDWLLEEYRDWRVDVNTHRTKWCGKCEKESRTYAEQGPGNDGKLTNECPTCNDNQVRIKERKPNNNSTALTDLLGLDPGSFGMPD
jgi:hypothetical protein